MPSLYGYAKSLTLQSPHIIMHAMLESYRLNKAEGSLHEKVKTIESAKCASTDRRATTCKYCERAWSALSTLSLYQLTLGVYWGDKGVTMPRPPKSPNNAASTFISTIHLLPKEWRSQPKNLGEWGSKILGAKNSYFRLKTLLCLEYRISKHKMTRYFKHWGHFPLSPTWLRLCPERL